jgi:glutaredoxin
VTQKTIIEKKKETVIVTPAVTKTVITNVPRIVWDCDFCSRGSGDRMRSCLGCGKHACDFCRRDKEFFKEYEFEVGESGDEDSYNGTTSESEDHRIGYFYLCPECRKNLPAKIQMLMVYIRNLESIEEQGKKVTNKILDEIERLKK